MERGPAPNAWQRFSAGDGAKGPRLYDWALVPYSGAAEGFRHALLVRRSIAKPHELTFYLTHAPEATTPAALVRVAGTRWSIESLFEQAKGEVGLDQYEVRSGVGWHRYITLAMCALACLAAIRKAATEGSRPDEPGRRIVAADGARDQASAVGAGRPELTPASRRSPLVRVAPKTSATRTTRSLAQSNTAVAA